MVATGAEYSLRSGGAPYRTSICLIMKRWNRRPDATGCIHSKDFFESLDDETSVRSVEVYVNDHDVDVDILCAG